MGIIFLPLALVGLILGIIALVSISKNSSIGGKGLAIAAIVVGVLGILLFLFALLFSFMVLNLGRTYVDQTEHSVTEKSKRDIDLKCSLDVMMKFVEIAGKPQICVHESGENSFFKAQIQNMGSKKISSLEITGLGDSGIFSNKSLENSEVGIAEVKNIEVHYSQQSIGSFKKILIVPIVEINGKQTPCTGAGSVLEEENVAACT